MPEHSFSCKSSRVNRLRLSPETGVLICPDRTALCSNRKTLATLTDAARAIAAPWNENGDRCECRAGPRSMSPILPDNELRPRLLARAQRFASAVVVGFGLGDPLARHRQHRA